MWGNAILRASHQCRSSEGACGFGLALIEVFTDQTMAVKRQGVDTVPPAGAVDPGVRLCWTFPKPDSSSGGVWSGWCQLSLIFSSSTSGSRWIPVHEVSSASIIWEGPGQDKW